MISAIILSKNEEKNIRACIESVLWCDEIIVIDDNSEDETVRIAKNLGAMVYMHDLNRDFAAQRNFGLEKARQEWVLFIDADERVSDALRLEITGTISARRNRYVGYYLRRSDVLWGRKMQHGETAKIKLLRLGRKESGKWNGSVHEKWEMTGHVAELREELLHYPHPSLKEFLTEVNFYTDIRAAELHRKKIKSSWWTILLYTKGKFFQNYILRLGFLDGIPGIVSATMMSFHSFLVRGKLWLLWYKK
jgi:glycosyltransferase involved in cell wall biosynthesis